MFLPVVRTLPVYLLFIGLASPLPALAEESAAPPPTEMETVTVTGRPEDQLTGSNTLDRSTLDRLPALNGSLNETLGILPGVQFSESGRTSTTAGEITPPKISISGGKTYQNNFQIDGISNNSLLDPEADSPISLVAIPGHAQSLFLDTDLVEKITVYRYNVPARFGNFTGGVVDVSTREPGQEFFGEAVYRTTRHEWTQFHIDPTIKAEFENSTSQKYQPKFEKHNAGLMLNFPLTERLGLLASYQLNYSKITLNHFLEEEATDRRNENFFAKLAYDISSRTRLTTSIQHAPFDGDYLFANSRGGEFTISGEGDQVILGLEHTTALGNFTLSGAWKYNDTSREAAPDLYTWAVTPSKPWGTSVGTTSLGKPASYEGGVGSLETSQEGFQLKGEFEGQNWSSGPLTHQINAGIDFEQATGMMERDEPTNLYFFPVMVAADFICPPGSDACIDGEQYLKIRQYYAPAKARATINLLDGYMEDHITWDRIQLRPGFRISYDDFMENSNVSPRFSASYDLFGNERTILFGGLNRYYGRTLLTYKIREASIPAQTFARDPVTLDWIAPAAGRSHRYSELDTPYTDETVLGIDQELFGGRLKIVGLKREGRDEFAQEKIDIPLPDGSTGKYYQLTNRGESHHRELGAEWERAWKDHYLFINVTWQETETDNETYSSSIELDDINEIVWYDGNYVPIDEAPRRDFNRNWTGNLTYSTRLPLGIVFTNVTHYRSGYESIVLLSTAQKSALGIPPTVVAYKNEDFPDAWIFDWRFDWDMLRDQSLIVSLEINNVLDEEVELGDPTSTSSSSASSYTQNYELGRQFWLGMTYKF